MNEKRVISLVRGGIGNQMFIYAASRRIALRNNARLSLVTDFFKNESHGRHFLLDMFSINADITNIKEADFPYSAVIHKFARKLDRHIYPFSRHYPHYLIERTKDYFGRRFPVDTRVLDTGIDDYLIVDGFFQNEAYFSDIRGIIKSDFTLKQPPNQGIQDIANEISASNSVCIHFRRTELEQKEMLKKHGQKRWMKGYTQGLGIDYYRKAIDIIENRIPSPRYFCFSDNPDWVRNNIHLPVPVTYITQNNTPSTCLGDIYLMNQCKHHIISHSTFGWWGAWLTANPDQIVVAPVNICSRPKPPDYPGRWTTIEVCQKKVP